MAASHDAVSPHAKSHMIVIIVPSMLPESGFILATWRSIPETSQAADSSQACKADQMCPSGVLMTEEGK